MKTQKALISVFAASCLLTVWTMSGLRAQTETAKALVKQAEAAFNKGDYEKTVTLCRKAIAADAKYVRAYTWLGTAYAKLKKDDLAREAFKKVLALQPKGPDADLAREALKKLESSSPPEKPATVTCSNPQCGKETDATAAFCKHCGTKLKAEPQDKPAPITCPNPQCAKDTEATAAFCKFCGTKLKAEPSTPTPPPSSSPVTTYIPLTAGNRWTYTSVTQGFMEVSGTRLPLQDTRGTLTVEIIGPSDQVAIAANVMVQRSVLSERGTIGGQFNELHITETWHLGWAGDWLLLYQAETQEDPTEDAKVQRYSPPLRLFRKTPRGGDGWDVGVQRAERLSLPTRARVVEFEDVTVPAGTFKGCAKLIVEVTEPRGQIESEGLVLNVRGGHIVETRWLAPGVGIVKSELTMTMTLELMGNLLQMQRTHTYVLQPGYQVAK
ncbi:MAG: zinc ribbon domain-containing protein [Abditibacteriales bacterium]|nr:zinc ribbon domain-containing protein [Abditibacteriales bacterium]MDW8366890.1 zinc ribbon domain-containing protein [Abditibacteriales bacterium]